MILHHYASIKIRCITCAVFFDRYGDEDFKTVGDNEGIGSHNVYDYAVSVIGFLIKEGYFNKEYLEE